LPCMNQTFTLKLNHMIKKTLASITLLGVVGLALASSGGGKAKSKSSVETGFATNKSYSGFTLKAGPRYTGSQLFSTQKSGNVVLFNSVVTYQKGNTVYILPYKYKMSTKPGLRSNLNVVDLKFNLHR
jgi:hypothetical protein